MPKISKTTRLLRRLSAVSLKAINAILRLKNILINILEKECNGRSHNSEVNRGNRFTPHTHTHTHTNIDGKIVFPNKILHFLQDSRVFSALEIFDGKRQLPPIMPPKMKLSTAKNCCRRFLCLLPTESYQFF